MYVFHRDSGHTHTLCVRRQKFSQNYLALLAVTRSQIFLFLFAPNAGHDPLNRWFENQCSREHFILGFPKRLQNSAPGDKYSSLPK